MRFRFTQPKESVAFRGKVMLDDYDASSAVYGFTVGANVNDVTTVTLEIPLMHGMELDMGAVVFIPAATVDLLVAHGWTPPEGAEVKGGAMSLKPRAKEPDLLDMAVPHHEGCPPGCWHVEP